MKSRLLPLALVATLYAAAETPPLPPTDAKAPLLVWDVDQDLRGGLPRNFRTSGDPLDATSRLDETGLRELRASGSGQFTVHGLELLLRRLSGPVTVFDLRQESHVFADGLPISWYATNNWANVGRTHAEIDEEEQARIDACAPGTRLVLSDDNVKKAPDEAAPSETLVARAATSERHVVEAAGASYVRIAVTDHARPTDGEVDRFVMAVRALPKDGWAHFHCRAGRGRTTTFMALYDMLRNANILPIEAIAKRQEVLAGDYDVLRVGEPGNWKEPYTADRVAFVRSFYEYARANPGGRPLLWSEWPKRPMRSP